MEYLQYEFQGTGQPKLFRSAVLAGVVSSGNLEVLIEAADLNGRCSVEVRTSAQGYSDIWRAVLNDFAVRHDLSNLQISINDGGATPAVVSLRLDQAIEEYAEPRHD
ncbi:MAG: malonate decarboxylase acyl carrier protein [Desulfuromonadales bacterium]|nr:malonate decarboxylase acyl carrier protein [Desulfuromonadales bacterium]